MWLSQRREITIISADSRQIYRRFDVGTAKPTADDRRRVPHVAVDVVEPTDRYSASQWSSLAQDTIVEARRAGRIPVVVGGTGFYISALFRPLFIEPQLDAARRARLQRALQDAPLAELQRWCTALDPARAHLGRTQLLRAVEVALLTGERLSHLHVEHARPGAHRPSYLLVDPGSDLQGMIAARVSQMVGTGWPDEVRQLMDAVPPDAPAWNATGYEAVRRHVRGELGVEALQEQVIIETRQYAKRQRTWFRHQLQATRVQKLDPRASGWQEVVERWITEAEAEMTAERQ
jgi:tRNA dimethylallyltransferase